LIDEPPHLAVADDGEVRHKNQFAGESACATLRIEHRRI
jgi:hypothetical protein